MKKRPLKRVCCAYIENAKGEILLTQRLQGAHLAQLWEFPGGKIEAGENETQALQRELKEELDIEAEIQDELGRVQHAYEAFDVELILFRVTKFKGTPKAKQVADLMWVTSDWFAANFDRMPPADVPLLRLSQVHLRRS